MKKYTQEELNEILGKHKKWLLSEDGGERANLENANLESANLRYANLANANLENANLVNANLVNANLRYANLEDANLRYANLEDANLENANLRYANLENANLENANLVNANLVNANLEDANLEDEYYQLSRIGSNNRMTTWDATNDIVWCGCFKGSMSKFEEKIEKTHKDNPLYLGQYRLAVKYLKDLRDLKAKLK